MTRATARSSVVARATARSSVVARAVFAAGVTIGATVVFTGCRRTATEGDRGVSPAAVAPPTPAPSTSAGELRLRAVPRCVLDGASLDPRAMGGASTAGIEIGDAVAYAGGYAIGLARPRGAGRVSSVALVDGSFGAGRLVDLGPTLGDAPPARVAPWASGLLAVAYAVPPDDARAASGRELAVVTVTPGGAVEPRATIAEERDDSLAFDVAATKTNAVVVWDEATARGHGFVRALEVTPGVAAVPRTISAPDADVELPQIVVAGAGFVALWLAQRPEEPDPATDAGAGEVTGEERSLGWVEALALDAHGAAAGPVRRLTAATGHVSAFDAETLGDGTLLVIARDDGETTDGSGGALLRVRVAGAHVDPPVAVADEGLGRGAPELTGGALPWLSWVGPEERLRLLPLDATGAPAGPPSLEERLVDARPLWISEGSPPGSTVPRALVATPDDDTSPLHVATCAR